MLFSGKEDLVEIACIQKRDEVTDRGRIPLRDLDISEDTFAGLEHHDQVIVSDDFRQQCPCVFLRETVTDDAVTKLDPRTV